MTAPQQVDYHDVLRVWREADAIPEIEHAWLFDHLMPIGGDPNGPTYEGWTLLSALAAQTRRLRLGLLVTSNRFRPPALLAKIAATVDIVSDGRLDFGIGAGSRPSHPAAPGASTRRTACRSTTPPTPWAASPRRAPSSGACGPRTEPFDFARHVPPAHRRLLQPQARPAPHPPILIGGRSSRCCACRRARRPLEHPGRDIETPSAAARCSTASAPSSAATPPRSPARSTCRSTTTSPATRPDRRRVDAASARRPRPPRPTPRAWRSGSDRLL